MRYNIKHVYTDALLDKEFEQAMIKDEPSNREYFGKDWIDRMMTDSKEKALVCMAYYGWLLGKEKSTLKYRIQ